MIACFRTITIAIFIPILFEISPARADVCTDEYQGDWDRMSKVPVDEKTLSSGQNADVIDRVLLCNTLDARARILERLDRWITHREDFEDCKGIDMKAARARWTAENSRNYHLQQGYCPR
jgi:hypothetical protein